MEFDVEFPVVGRVRFRRFDGKSEPLVISEVYFEPLAERIRHFPDVSATELFRLYDFGEGPWDVEGCPWTFKVQRELVECLRTVAAQGFVLQTSRFVSANGEPPASETVLAAMIRFFEAAEASDVSVEVTTLP